MSILLTTNVIRHLLNKKTKTKIYMYIFFFNFFFCRFGKIHSIYGCRVCLFSEFECMMSLSFGNTSTCFLEDLGALKTNWYNFSGIVKIALLLYSFFFFHDGLWILKRMNVNHLSRQQVQHMYRYTCCSPSPYSYQFLYDCIRA